MGIFDGVHMAHQKIIERIIRISKQVGGSSVLVTLWPHPKHVLPSSDNYHLELLTTLEEKKQILEDLGIDYLVILPFDEIFAQKSFQNFIKEILVEYLSVYQVIVGFNHQFGKGRQGDYEKLEELSHFYGFKLEKIDPVITGYQRISSSIIRTYIKDGNIGVANKMLGRTYSFKGHVKSGSKVGSSIGFPTANIFPDDALKLIPCHGVYAVRVGLDDKVYKGMLNIGVKPTINNESKESIEVNIFDFNEDIYNKEIRLYFIERIRDERKFNNVNELKEQLKKDKQHAKLVLTQNK